MLVTRETDYAVRCVLYLARDRDKVTSVAEVAAAMHIPKSFLAKIVQRLVRSGILESIRGVKGGFRLAKKTREINLLAILEAIQGSAGINLCAIDEKRCRLSSTCSVHPHVGEHEEGSGAAAETDYHCAFVENLKSSQGGRLPRPFRFSL